MSIKTTHLKAKGFKPTAISSAQHHCTWEKKFSPNQTLIAHQLNISSRIKIFEFGLKTKTEHDEVFWVRFRVPTVEDAERRAQQLWALLGEGPKE